MPEETKTEDDAIYALTARQAERIADILGRVEHMPRNKGDTFSEIIAATTDIQLVWVFYEIPDSNGLFQGKIILYDSATDTYEELDDCWVTDANGRPLETGYYLGRRVGDIDNRACFIVISGLRDFTGLITTREIVDGIPVYQFIEQSADETGAYIQPDNPKFGHCVEINNYVVSVGIYKWIRLRGIINGEPVWEFDHCCTGTVDPRTCHCGCSVCSGGTPATWTLQVPLSAPCVQVGQIGLSNVAGCFWSACQPDCVCDCSECPSGTADTFFVVVPTGYDDCLPAGVFGLDYDSACLWEGGCHDVSSSSSSSSSSCSLCTDCTTLSPDCCASVPKFITLQIRVGGTDEFEDADIVMHHQPPVDNLWAMTETYEGSLGQNLYANIRCVMGQWQLVLNITPLCNSMIITEVSSTCDPFSINFGTQDISGCMFPTPIPGATMTFTVVSDCSCLNCNQVGCISGCHYPSQLCAVITSSCGCWGTQELTLYADTSGLPSSIHWGVAGGTSTYIPTACPGIAYILDLVLFCGPVLPVPQLLLATGVKHLGADCEQGDSDTILTSSGCPTLPVSFDIAFSFPNCGSGPGCPPGTHLYVTISDVSACSSTSSSSSSTPVTCRSLNRIAANSGPLCNLNNTGSTINSVGPAISISIWCRPTSLPNPTPLFTHFGGPGMYNWALYANSGGSILWSIKNNNTPTAGNLLYPGILNVGVWSHVVATYDGTSTMKLYVNGTLYGTQSYSGGMSLDNLIAWIGFDYTANSYDGKAMDARIWNVGLSASDVIAIYNGGCPNFNDVTTTYPSLKAWYKLDEIAVGDCCSFGCIIANSVVGTNDVGVAYSGTCSVNDCPCP